jgi:hypothetical protein
MLYIHLAIEGSTVLLDSSGRTFGYTQDFDPSATSLQKHLTGLAIDIDSSVDVGTCEFSRYQIIGTSFRSCAHHPGPGLV